MHIGNYKKCCKMAAAPHPGDVRWGTGLTLEKTIDAMIQHAESNYGDDYLQEILWSGANVWEGKAEYETGADSSKMDYFNEADENEPEVDDDDVRRGYSHNHTLPPSYPESLDIYTQPTLNVPGQNLDFDFENVIVQNENEANVTAENKRKDKNKTSKQKRSLFRRKRHKKSNQSLLGATSSGDSEEFAYDNHIALEGVENTHPAIVVSQVRDGNDVIDDEEGFPAFTSIDIFDEDDEAFTPTGTISKGNKNKRKKSRKFSIASALTDISFRSDRSNSTKISSPSLLDVDWEADDDLRDSLTEFIRNRNGGDGGRKRHRRKRGSTSTRSSDSEMYDGMGKKRDFKSRRLGSLMMHTETSDLLDMYSSKQNDEDRIFENLKIQNELIASVRTQPWPMKKKLKTLQLAKSYVERYEGQLSRGHGYQEASAKYWKRLKREFMNFLSLLIPWEMRIKLIESYFGSVVASYFTFLRWMFWVNIVMTVLSACFIIIPEILFGTPWGSTPQKSVPEDELAKALNFDTILDWRGYLEHSFLFYGYYANTPVIGGIYRLPLAYLLVGLSAFATSFLIILRKMTANARLNKLTSKDEQYTFMWKTFTSWDFMIGNAETAKNKVAEITTVLRETIEEEKERTKKKTTKTLFFMRVLANILVLIVLVSSTYAIYLAVERSQKVEKRLQRGEEVGWWDQNEVSFVMALITALFPTLFDVIGLMEKYHPRINLRLQLGRILVLYLMNLYTLMFALYWKIVDKAEAAANQSASNCTITGTTLPPPITVTQLDGMFNTTNCTGATGDGKVCWETMLGQEISKLVFFDLLVTVATIVFIDFVRGLGVRYLNRYWCWDLEQKFPEYGEFKIAENLLHAIYNQATVWLGVFFAPLLPAVNIFKLLVMLYTRSWAVLVCNIPHERVFKASGSNNFYFGTLLLMLFLVTLPVAFLLVSLKPSGDCGPFKGYEKSYHVLTKTIETELPEWVSKVLDYIASPGTIMPLLLLLLMAIYYLSSLNASLKESNNDLRNQLHVERTEEREKAYKLGGARADGNDGPGDSKVSPPVDEKPKPPPDKDLDNVKVERDKDKDSGEELPTGEEEAPPPGKRGTRVMRIPGMSLDQANLLKSKYPGLRVMNKDEAVRLNIIPPPPPPPPEPESDPEPEVKVDIEPVVDTDTPIDTSRESEHHPDDIQVKQGEIQKEDAVTASDLMTSHISQSRPVRTRPGPGSSPPIAIVQGKPSMQSNRFRFGDTAQDPTRDDAVLF